MLRVEFPARSNKEDAYRWGARLANLPGLKINDKQIIEPLVLAPPHVKQNEQRDVILYINDAAWELASKDEYLARDLPARKVDEEVPEYYRDIRQL